MFLTFFSQLFHSCLLIYSWNFLSLKKKRNFLLVQKSFFFFAVCQLKKKSKQITVKHLTEKRQKHNWRTKWTGLMDTKVKFIDIVATIYSGTWIIFSSLFWWCHFMASKAKIFNFGFQAWKLRPTKQTSLEVSQPSCSRKQLKKLGMFILFLPASCKHIWNLYILSGH